MSLAATLLRRVCLFGLLYFVNCEWIDLSYVYNNKTLYWGTSTRFQHKKLHAGPVKANNVTIIPYYSAFDITTAEHGGTHLDAPLHFVEGAWSVNDIPAENLVGFAVVVDISAKSAIDRNAQLTVDDLNKWEENHGTISDGSILFVFTDWGKYWPNSEKYFGTNTTNTALYRFPGIHKDAATWLVNNRNVKGVGIDTASIDYGKSKTFPTHEILFKKNIYGLENVANLDKLPVTGTFVYALPMKIENGSGAPVRILASMPKSGVGRNYAATFRLFALAFVAMALLHVD